MREFDLQNNEYIELNKFLKLVGVAESGGHAKQLIDEKKVKVNGINETRRRKKLRTNDVVLTMGYECKMINGKPTAKPDVEDQ